MAHIAIAKFVDESTVPISRRGGPGNPEIAAVAEQLIAAADERNTGFAFIPVEEKVERRRTGESIRNQLKARGYNCEKVAGTGKATVKRPGSTPGKFKRVTEVVEGLYMRATPIDVGTKPRRKKRAAVE
jgi:hypothetical protein